MGTVMRFAVVWFAFCAYIFCIPPSFQRHVFCASLEELCSVVFALLQVLSSLLVRFFALLSLICLYDFIIGMRLYLFFLFCFCFVFCNFFFYAVSVYACFVVMWWKSM